AAEQRRARGRAEEQAVRRHAAEPVRGDLHGMHAVVRPLVEDDFDRAAAEKHADDEREDEIVDVADAQAEALALVAQPEKHLREAGGVREAVPPEIDDAEVEEDRINAM